MKKKIFIGGITIILILAVIFVGKFYLSDAQDKAAIQTIPLKKTDLVDSVLASGTITSSDSMNVYSELNTYPVKEVYVSVGDTVKAGDVLAQLDTSSLELDIKQTELNIRNAELAIKNENSANQSNLENASNGVKTASIELENAQRNYDKLKELFEAGASSHEELIQAESALKKAQLSYDNAQTALENSQGKNTSSAKNNLQIQKVALEKQKKALSDANIVAPIDGTVTLVNAKANEPSTGLLFVVEDTENLIASTSIGEYDIGLIQTEQEVTIKTDSTGDKEFIGTISKIAPTASKDAAGNTDSSSNVQFDTEVSLKNNEPDLKIGMNARLTIKVNEKKNVFTVPYEAIVTQDDGSEWIYVLKSSEKNENAKNTIQKIQVETGMETDMYVEISSGKLKDGLKVITNPEDNAQIAEMEAKNND